MKRKIIVVLIMTVVFAIAVAGTVSASEEPSFLNAGLKIYVDGRLSDALPISREGVTFVKSSTLSRMLGTAIELCEDETIEFTEDAPAASAAKESALERNVKVTVAVREGRLRRDGAEQETLILEYDGEIYLPLRQSAELCGFTVDYNGFCHCVELLSPEISDAVTALLQSKSVAVESIAEAQGIEAYLNRRYPFGGGCRLDTDLSGELITVTARKSMLRELSDTHKRVKAEIEAILSKILTPKMSVEEIVKAINEYICENYSYDATLQNRRLTTEVKSTLTCEAYASLFWAMALTANIQAEVTTGRWSSPDGKSFFHCWDRLFLNGEYREVDITWNDGSNRSKYLLLTHNEMERAHLEAVSA